MNHHDRRILIHLAKVVAELAARPIEEIKKRLWYSHNALESTPPVIFCDPENGWNEIILPGDLECQEELARRWEMILRKEIFWGEHLQDDRVICPIFDVAHVYTESDWGMHEVRIGGKNGGAYTWKAPLQDFTDYSKLRFPVIQVDWMATENLLHMAHSIFDGILDVRLKTSWWWTLGMTWTLVNLRGLAQIMLDMVDQPENFQRLMAFLRDGTLARLDFLEKSSLLSLNNDGTYVGSGGFGWVHELPQPDYAGKVRTMDLWGFAESQETVGISPAMFAEFIFPYQLPLLERFGLNCYGCCEPLDKRWPVIREIPRLRRISVSPWADISRMAEFLGDRYIFSWKPAPSDLAMPSFDEAAIRKKLHAGFEAMKKHNCCVEIIMKDTHTIAKDPRRVIRWVKIAKEEAETYRL
jgi:hypothetical protein